MKNKLKFKIHIGRIIVYLLLFAIAIGYYRFLHSHFFFMILVLMAAAPVISIGLVFILRAGLSVEVNVPERIANKNSINYIRVILHNKTYLMSLDVNMNLVVKNDLYGFKNNTFVSLPTRMHADSEILIPMRLNMNGIIKYEVDAFTVTDLLGFVEIKKKVKTEAEVLVFPDVKEELKADISEMSTGMTETEESSKKGSDFSDVSDVREYIPGDRLMSIHWKLSAKRDILMVKDRATMSDQQMVILVEMSGPSESVDAVITLAFALISRLLSDNTAVKLLWWNKKLQEFGEAAILNREDIINTFTRIYYENQMLHSYRVGIIDAGKEDKKRSIKFNKKNAGDIKAYEIIPDESDMTAARLQQIRPELKAFVHIKCKEGGHNADVTADAEVTRCD